MILNLGEFNNLILIAKPHLESNQDNKLIKINTMPTLELLYHNNTIIMIHKLTQLVSVYQMGVRLRILERPLEQTIAVNGSVNVLHC